MKTDEIRKMVPNMERPSTQSQQQAVMDRMMSLGVDLSSSYQELEMSCQYVDTHRDTSFSNTLVQLHSHVFYEILCCTNNCGVEYLVGSNRYRLQRGDLILIPPGVSHRPILPPRMTEPYKRDVLWISQEFVDLVKTLSPDLDMAGHRVSYLLRTAGTQWEFLPEMFHTGVLESEQRSMGWKTAVLGNTMKILTNLYRAFQDDSTAPLRAEKPVLLDRVMAHIEQHLAEKLTLGEIAKHFYVSESTVSHIFQQTLGVSFYRCVTQRRLISAKELILENLPLETVGERVGFSDYSAFYRAFKREYGISPRQYRKISEQ